jgi:N-methylhydantoinase B
VPESQRVDPITLSVLWNGLVSIAEEMGQILLYAAFSEGIREAQDFSTALFDAMGRNIAQGTFSPGHLGSMPFAVRNVLCYLPKESLRPGDAVLLNALELGTGHYPDMLLVAPIFHNGQLVAFSASCGHHADVGGAVPGSQAVVGVREAFQEGIRIPPILAFREGKRNEDVMRILLANVRLPEKVEGDLMAQWAASRLAHRRLGELLDRYGYSVWETTVDEILAISEREMRESIRRTIPEGVYSFEDKFDDSGPGTDSIRVAVKVTVHDGEVTVDFGGSSPQVPAGMNAYLNYTRAYVLFTIKALVNPTLPQNEGCFRPIHTRAPEGSFFNPRYPAPGGGRAIVQTRICEVIHGALSQAIPEKVLAGFSHWINPNIGGVDPEGRPFIYFDLIMGGYGARLGRDGQESLVPVFNCANVPVEVHETNNPVRIHRLAFIQDSGGPGQFRGGSGLRKDVEVLVDAVLTNLTDRQVTRPFGLRGGHPGTPGETWLIRGDVREPIHSKAITSLKKGDVISFRTSGAGGVGDPLLRDPEMVRRDVLEGYVSLRAAEAMYGVRFLDEHCERFAPTEARDHVSGRESEEGS